LTLKEPGIEQALVQIHAVVQYAGNLDGPVRRDSKQQKVPRFSDSPDGLGNSISTMQ